MYGFKLSAKFFMLSFDIFCIYTYIPNKFRINNMTEWFTPKLYQKIDSQQYVVSQNNIEQLDKINDNPKSIRHF